MIKVMAGIVLYNADIERLTMEIQSVLPQVDLLCLCDNGSTNIDDIENMFVENSKIILLKNDRNMGIGVASNQICEYAMKNEFEWVLMLDHDTVCPQNLIETYIQHTGDSEVGIICPQVVDVDIVRNKYKSTNSKSTEFVQKCIQSASFVRVSAWELCGGFNEWMFIDFVDFDFCKRMEVNGYKILRCNDTTVDHQLGKREHTRCYKIFDFLYRKTGRNCFRYFTYKNIFSEARIYYCTRNNIAYIKLFADFIDVKKERREFVSRVLRRIVRGRNRLMIVRETIKGTRDGVKLIVTKYSRKS